MKLNTTILAVLTATIGAASAATISINFRENNNNQVMDPGTTAGLDVQSNWNNTDGSTASTMGSLIDSTGVVTTASVTWETTGGLWGDGTANTDANAGVGDAQLRRGYLDDNGAITFSMSGITYASYDVIVYYSSGDTGNKQFQATTIGGTTLLPTAAAGANNKYATNPNWDDTNTVTFSALSGASFSGSVAARNTVGTGRGTIAGIQVVEVPEPSSAALLGLGGLALILRRRK
jgi:hypothetical protein